MPRKYVTSLTPEERRERSRNAGRAAHSTSAHVRAVVARLNERRLTDDERATLAAALEAATR